jgi:hypothetical protein
VVDDGSTLMSLRSRGEAAEFAAITAPMLAAAMRRANRNDLAGSSNSSRRHPRTRSGAPQADSPSCGRVSGGI